MTLEKRTEAIDKLFAGCRGILDAKGKDYSGKEDALANFKKGAESLGMTKYQILAVYLSKHLASIMNAIKTSPSYPQVESEPMEGRIQDAINYLAILHAMMEEDRENLVIAERDLSPVGDTSDI